MLAALLAGCGGNGLHAPATANDPGYPAAPYGYAAGDVLPDLQFTAKWLAPGDDSTTKPTTTISLGRMRDARLIVIEVAARWCPECNDDQPSMMKLESDYAAQGVVGVEVLFEGAYNVAATTDDIDAWWRTYGVTGAIAVDDHYAFVYAADVSAIPVYLVVDTRDMRIVDRAAATLTERPLGPILDGLLAAR